jgi:phosphatidylglycerol:prolipoprotein diacylglycerol transferase
MGMGWGIAYQIYFSLIKIDRFRAQLLFWGIFFSAWIGAKLFFIFTSGESQYLTSPGFWMGGGFVFYGGLIAGLLFVFIFRHFSTKLSLENLWPILPALTIGHAIGRLGCLLAGCCFGRTTDLAWGIFLHGHYRHPTQLIESLGLFLIGGFLLKSKAHKLKLFWIYVISYGFLRMIVESLRGDTIRGQWFWFTPSQWISLVFILVGTGFLLRKFNNLSVVK